MNLTNLIVSIQIKLRDGFRGIIKQNGAIIVVILNTALVAFAQNGKAISTVTVAQVLANSVFYFVWVDFKFKLAFKALLAGGVSHIATVSLIALYMRYFASQGKRYELPFYIEGYLNQIVVMIVFAISIIWIFSGNNEGQSTELEKDNQFKDKDKDFYG